MDLGLNAKRCIVTGGSKGIGAATAEALAAEGASLALIARTPSALEAAAARVRDLHGTTVHAVVGDLSTPTGVAAAAKEATDRLGGVDVLVNNAGASAAGTFDQIDDTAWQAAFDLKLMGYVRMIRAVLPSMRSQGAGVVVNVGGAAARKASPGYILGCFNVALAHLTRALAEDVGPSGVRVCCVHPGLTETERLTTMFSVAADREQTGLDQVRSRASSGIPLRRLGQPDEVGHMIALLCSDAASLVTGESMLIDGGASTGAL